MVIIIIVIMTSYIYANSSIRDHSKITEQMSKKEILLKEMLNSQAKLYRHFVYRKICSGFSKRYSWDKYVETYIKVFNNGKWEKQGLAGKIRTKEIKDKDFLKMVSNKKTWGTWGTYTGCPDNKKRIIKTKREIKYVQEIRFRKYHKLESLKDPDWFKKTIRAYASRVKKRLREAERKKKENGRYKNRCRGKVKRRGGSKGCRKCF